MKNNKTIKDRKILITIWIITVIIVIVLWYFDFRNESIITIILGLAIWAIRTIVIRHFKNLDDKVDEQKQILLQSTQTGFGFKQSVLIDMYNVTKELWKKSIWIGDNWNALWPRNKSDDSIKKEFLTQFDEYKKFLKTNSIIMG